MNLLTIMSLETESIKITIRLLMIFWASLSLKVRMRNQITLGHCELLRLLQTRDSWTLRIQGVDIHLLSLTMVSWDSLSCSWKNVVKTTFVQFLAAQEWYELEECIWNKLQRHAWYHMRLESFSSVLKNQRDKSLFWKLSSPSPQSPQTQSQPSSNLPT